MALTNGRYSYLIYRTDDIEFGNEEEAYEALLKIRKIYNCGCFVTIGDVRDIAGLDVTTEDNEYGWDDIHDCKLWPSRNGNGKVTIIFPSDEIQKRSLI